VTPGIVYKKNERPLSKPDPCLDRRLSLVLIDAFLVQIEAFPLFRYRDFPCLDRSFSFF
jgi:hypothetical protein